MALYKDGNPVSGLNSIPRLTLAQYNALNVKPEFWVRTDAPESYKKLSADQVSYDSNNTVKDMLDFANPIKKGVTYSLSHIICAGHNSGSGNYVEIFLPCDYDPTISNMALSSNSSLVVYSANGIVTESGIDFSTQTLTKTALGLRLELKYSSTKTANIPVSVGFSTSSIVFS